MSPCDTSKNPLEAAEAKTGSEGISRTLSLSNPSLSIHLSASGNRRLFSFIRLSWKVPLNCFSPSKQDLVSMVTDSLMGTKTKSEIKESTFRDLGPTYINVRRI